MPNALKHSRRAAFAALASIPALALPVVATAGAAPASDPVFAAIEAHCASWMALKGSRHESVHFVRDQLTY